MPDSGSRVTIHMAASLDGFIARKDGGVDWMETSDHFDAGEVMAAESVAAFLRTIDCWRIARLSPAARFVGESPSCASMSMATIWF
ncbi:MAG TPA: hypothetical protein VFG84_06265 [Gemmatimonadaceae bacterium]|nr:hypothetical protein [Gemmatimonadaceae bacterium]